MFFQDLGVLTTQPAHLAHSLRWTNAGNGEVSEVEFTGRLEWEQC